MLFLFLVLWHSIPFLCFLGMKTAKSALFITFNIFAKFLFICFTVHHQIYSFSFSHCSFFLVSHFKNHHFTMRQIGKYKWWICNDSFGGDCDDNDCRMFSFIKECLNLFCISLQIVLWKTLGKLDSYFAV